MFDLWVFRDKSELHKTYIATHNVSSTDLYLLIVLASVHICGDENRKTEKKQT